MKYPALKEKERTWLNHFNQLVIRNLNDSIMTNAWLAAMMSMSERKLYRIIYRLTGQTPNQYIRNIRLEIAYDMLDSGLYRTVKKVATKVGFRKADYFTQLFKEKYGLTPIKVLRNSNEKE